MSPYLVWNNSKWKNQRSPRYVLPEIKMRKEEQQSSLKKKYRQGDRPRFESGPVEFILTQMSCYQHDFELKTYTM